MSISKYRTRYTKAWKMADLVEIIKTFMLENEGRQPTGEDLNKIHIQHPEKCPSLKLFGDRGLSELIKLAGATPTYNRTGHDLSPSRTLLKARNFLQAFHLEHGHSPIEEEIDEAAQNDQCPYRITLKTKCGTTYKTLGIELGLRPVRGSKIANEMPLPSKNYADLQKKK